MVGAGPGGAVQRGPVVVSVCPAWTLGGVASGVRGLGRSRSASGLIRFGAFWQAGGADPGDGSRGRFAIY